MKENPIIFTHDDYRVTGSFSKINKSYSKSKRRDVFDVIIPTNLVCVFFGPTIPILHPLIFNSFLYLLL